MNISKILTTSAIPLLCYSCNTSLSLLDRRYRPGYTIEFTKNCAPELKNQSSETLVPIQPIRSYEDLEVCSKETTNPVIHPKPLAEINTISEPIENKTIQPMQVISKKKVSEQSLITKEKLKRVNEGEPSGKPMEPFSLVACVLLGLGILAGVIFYSAPLLAILLGLVTLGLIFIFSMISLRRIDKHPDKYSKVSKILDQVFIITSTLVFVFLWAIIKSITRSK